MALRATFERDLSNLAHPGRVTNPAHNVAGHGDTLLIGLPRVPPVDGQLLIYVVQSPPDESRNAPDESDENIIGTFSAEIRQGKLSNVSGHATPASFDPDLHLMQVHVAAPGATGAKGQGPKVTLTIFPTTLRINTRYSLRVRTYVENAATPKSKKKLDVWDASASVWVHYHLSMVIPTGTFHGPLTPQHHHTAKQDKSLTWIRKWAVQWRKHQPEFREFFLATTLACPPGCFSASLTPQNQPQYNDPHFAGTDFDDVIDKIEKGAKFAKHGIVALAVGHGDGSTAWFNLAPEDAIYERNGVEFFPSPRVIKLQNLRFLDNPMATSHNNTVKKLALNRLGPVFAGAPIRLFLLHTCNLGGKLEFLDRLAKEMQVYAAGHKDFITYSDASLPPVEASYDKDGDIVAKHQKAQAAHLKSKQRLKQLELELASVGNDPIDEMRIRSEIEAERKKRNELKKAADKLRAKAKRVTHHWPLDRASIQAPPNPGKGPES